jgi:hypothetical protein
MSGDDSGWVHRAAPVAPVVAPHECDPPMDGHPRRPMPAGQPGDLWRCGCGRLWRHKDYRYIDERRWVRASLWQRLRWWGTPGAVEPIAKPPAPPAGESGVSRSPDGGGR